MIIIAFRTPTADNPAACHAGLGITASNSADVLVEHGIQAEAAAVTDGYHLRAGLRANAWPGVTHVALCAPFFDTPFLASLCAEFPKVTFSVVFHSNVGFLGVDNWSTGILGEQIALERQVTNFHVAGNSAKFCSAVMRALGAPCLLLPNLYFLHGPIERIRASWRQSDGALRIGVFGATRILKNLPTAAWAARILANDLGVTVELHVSTGREEGSGASSIVDNVRKLFAGSENVKLIESPWLPWLDFRRTVVRKMHLLFQPSFTESFNGVTADGIAEGVPTVVGHAIDWVPPNWIANPDDAMDIAAVAKSILRDKNAARDGYRALVRHNSESIGHWIDFVA